MTSLKYSGEVSPGKKAVFQVMSGASAGFLEVCINQPLDVVKTRLQLQAKPGSSGPTYSGLLDCVSKTYRQEGITAFWKGIVPPIIAETPKRAVKFLVFEQTRHYYQFGSKTPTSTSYSLAGITAGIVEGVVVNPFEVVKVAQQMNRGRNSLAILEARDIVRRHGFGRRGLMRGVTATICRSSTFNAAFFGLYHTVKTRMPKPENGPYDVLWRIATGFTAGVFGCLLNTPFDVAKSHIQGPQPVANEFKYEHTWRTLNIIYREEGFLALYKGLLPKIMRLGPGGAIMLVTFEFVYEYLVEHYA
ncbi:hypothetical protein KR093_001756 [Drosophila rubida]|uniref:Mitochondrial 2-oxodicarboxylate carrier n=1 Tax=Drosophila rubida TaxID=30044 RepID=A0AAD4JYK1_9MUSC|nr:hypothetical protein KR093_001756 [Drosophila rubida]